jgi:hypothetical protein
LKNKSRLGCKDEVMMRNGKGRRDNILVGAATQRRDECLAQLT